MDVSCGGAGGPRGCCFTRRERLPGCLQPAGRLVPLNEPSRMSRFFGQEIDVAGGGRCRFLRGFGLDRPRHRLQVQGMTDLPRRLADERYRAVLDGSDLDGRQGRRRAARPPSSPEGHRGHPCRAAREPMAEARPRGRRQRGRAPGVGEQEAPPDDGGGLEGALPRDRPEHGDRPGPQREGRRQGGRGAHRPRRRARGAARRRRDGTPRSTAGRRSTRSPRS